MFKKMLILKARLEYKADPNVCVNSASTMLMYAIDHVHVDIARLLLEHKANPAMHPAEGQRDAWKTMWKFRYKAALPIYKNPRDQANE